jgi:transposase
MITIAGEATKIHLATGPTDLRCGYSGLYTLIEHQFGAEPRSGHVWVFINRTRDLIKIFYWDSGGMCILGKRLHEGRFQAWPQRGQKIVMLTAAELQLLLSGLDLAKLRPRRWVRSPRPEPPAPQPTPTAGPLVPVQ